MLARARTPAGWQLILADLALILFLLTAAALTGADRTDKRVEVAGADDAPYRHGQAPALAPAQALYRAGPGIPSFTQWIAEQPRDPRATLTIVAQHRPDKAHEAWTQARALADSAAAQGMRVRVIIREGEANDVYASLAYDQPAP